MVKMCKNCIALCVEDKILQIGDEVCLTRECECKGNKKNASWGKYTKYYDELDEDEDRETEEEYPEFIKVSLSKDVDIETLCTCGHIWKSKDKCCGCLEEKRCQNHA